MGAREQSLEVTLVTTLRSLDPRRSLVAAISWLVIALAACLAGAAFLWVGSLARDNILQQHSRRLALETDQLASDLSGALRARRAALQSAQSASPARFAGPEGLRALLEVLQREQPQYEWLAIASPDGKFIAGDAQSRPLLTRAAAAAAGAELMLDVSEARSADALAFSPLATIHPALGDVVLRVRDGVAGWRVSSLRTSAGGVAVPMSACSGSRTTRASPRGPSCSTVRVLSLSALTTCAGDSGAGSCCRTRHAHRLRVRGLSNSALISYC